MVSRWVALVMLGWSGVAWGQEESLPESEAVAVGLGDFDCSGGLDAVWVYLDEDRNYRAEIAFDVPAPERVPSQPSTVDAVRLDVLDLDGDRCDDLSVTVDGLSSLLTRADLGDLTDGAGDLLPDVDVVYKQVPDHTTGGIKITFCIHVCHRMLTIGGKHYCIEWYVYCKI